MKKTLSFLLALCIAGIFSAKAQSSSDSSFARDFSYNHISINSLPNSTTGNLSSGGKILKDILNGSRAIGYMINLSSRKKLDIKMSCNGSTWGSCLYLLDTAFNIIVWSNNNIPYMGGNSRVMYDLPAGEYYILACKLDNSSDSRSYTLSINEVAFATPSTLTYTPITTGTPVTDTLKTTDGPLACQLAWYDSLLMMVTSYARAYTVQISSPCGLNVIVNRSNRIFGLFDNNYNLMSSYYIQTPGTYHIVVMSVYPFDADTSTATPFTLTAMANTPATFRDLTYRNINVNDTVRDSLEISDHILIGHEDDESYAKGYRIQTPSDAQYIDFQLLPPKGSGFDSYIYLLDANYNVIAHNDDAAGDFYSRILHLVQPSTTYYLVITTYSNFRTGNYTLYVKAPPLKTYYIDGINGNDANNGTIATQAIKTLDTAFARSGGIGLYYLTEDYTFSDNTLGSVFAHIYPYQKDIKLNWPASGYYNLLYINDGNSLVFGEQGSNYYFIMDSNHTNFTGDFFNGDYPESSIEINNFKVRNTYIPDDFIVGDKIVLRNCEFINDTVADEFIFTLTSRIGSLKLINCNFSQNHFGYTCIYVQESGELTMENTSFSGNTLGRPIHFYGATVNLTSGSWRNNRLPSDYNMNGYPNISNQNAAGIWARRSTLNIGAGFTMDVNNYLCLDSASKVNITENLTAPMVAQIYPIKYESRFVADYYEGRPLLKGSASLLQANYQKFSVAQTDNSAIWYIHPDGTIHSYPEGINEAGQGSVRLYPNPASNVLNIALDGNEVNEVVVIDIYGKTVARNTVADGTNTINISRLPAGMYFVQLRTDNAVKATQKLIKR